MEATSEEVCSTRFSRKSSASSTISSLASERCRQELDDYDVVFGVRPPSGTYHQQPGKHLSIDTRFSELSLENSSLIAESEREPSTLHRNGTSGSISRNKNKPSRVQVSKGNFYITSPFKQGPEKSAKRPTLVVDPSHDLKQRTIASVTKVKRQLDNVRRSQQFKLHHSQLQRGNLKPLGRPMTASGPAMNNCQGVVAGSRSYHGFTRRQKKTSLQDGKCQFSVFNSTKPDSPINQWSRPESSVHNTSYASSVDAANDDSDGSFSKDEDDQDSVDVENQACDLRGYTKKNDSSEKDIRLFSTGHGSNPKPSNTCKPYDDFFNRKGPKRDDDSDKEEGRWAQQTNQSVVYQEGGSRGNVTKKGQNKIGNGSTSGKQRSFGTNGDEENASSSYMYDLGVAKDLVDPLNISASTKPSQKIRNNVRRESDHSESTQLVKGTITNPLRSHSRVNTHKVIDVHVMDSDRQYATTERQHVTTVEQHVTTEEQHATMVGQHASTQGQHTTIDENALHGISKDFPKGEYSDDLLESDALDSDRIPSEVIFRVLDELNLSTSAMKPPTPSGDRSRGRRVQSAGHARRKPLVTKSETPLVKRDKRPASAKQVGRKKNQNTDCLDSSKINTASSTFGRAENLIKHTSEKIPGYFTEEYKKILEEKNACSKQADKVKTDAASSRSLCLTAREFTETSNDFGHDEKRDQNMATNLSSDSKEDERFSEIPDSEWTVPDKTKFLGQEQEKYSKRKNNSRSSLSGVFVTMDDKSELRGVRDAEDSSSGVETMSCVSDCPAFERFGDAMNNSSYDSPCEYRPDYMYGDEGEDGAYYDDIDDDGDDSGSGGGGGESVNFENVGNIDSFDDDVSNLEVVAKPKPLSESRYLKQKKSIAPFPPVCFNINARPPEGYLYYFAYGPDMNPNRMAIYLRREPKTRLWGILFGFQVRFNKRGTSEEAGGFPNVQFNPEHSVEGCVYAITDTELAMLDNCMGYPKHYTHAILPVWMLNSTSPSQHGVAQFCVPAVLYVAQNEWVINDSCQTLNCSYSVSQCMKASDILTPKYVEFMSSQAAS